MKKMLCLLLTVVLVLGMFAGCANNTAEPTESKAPTSPTVSENPPADNKDDSNETTDVPNLSGKTITLLTTDTWVSGLSLSDILPKFKQIEERTGCTIVWDTAPGGGDYDTLVQTRLTGDPSECPDIIMIGTNTSTLSKYIEDDLLYNIFDAFDVCPNIADFYNVYQPGLKGSFTYSDGGLYNLLANTYRNSEDQGKKVAVEGDNAIWYRADIAAELGFDTYPTTIEELYELLKAVKEAYPDMVPMHMWDWECWESARIFNAAYGLHYNNEQSGAFFYADADGKVQYEPATEATKEWLTEMNKWYEEGLIVVGASEEAKIGAAANGTTFSGFYAGVTGMCEEALKEIDPDAYFMYMPIPTKDGYETTYAPRAAFSNSFVIVDNGDEEQCKAALQFLDYAFYSDYGIYSDQAGVEGEGWTMGENGEFIPNPDYVAAVVKGEEVLQASGANIHFNGPTTYVFEVADAWNTIKEQVQKEMGKEDVMSPEQKANWEEVNAINASFYFSAYPTMYMSSDDQATLNALTADIDTFTNEMLTRYILGTADLDNFQTEFVDVLYNKMNLQQVLDIHQGYYDTYLENSGK